MRLETLYSQDIMTEGNFIKSLPLLAAGAMGIYGGNPAQAQDNKDVSIQKSVIVSDKDLGDYISYWEGKKSKAYLDSRGIPTIGIGFNLQRADARQLLKDVGADYNK